MPFGICLYDCPSCMTTHMPLTHVYTRPCTCLRTQLRFFSERLHFRRHVQRHAHGHAHGHVHRRTQIRHARECAHGCVHWHAQTHPKIYTHLVPRPGAGQSQHDFFTGQCLRVRRDQSGRGRPHSMCACARACFCACGRAGGRACVRVRACEHPGM